MINDGKIESMLKTIEGTILETGKLLNELQKNILLPDLPERTIILIQIEIETRRRKDAFELQAKIIKAYNELEKSLSSSEREKRLALYRNSLKN